MTWPPRRNTCKIRQSIILETFLQRSESTIKEGGEKGKVRQSGGNGRKYKEGIKRNKVKEAIKGRKDKKGGKRKGQKEEREKGTAKRTTPLLCEHFLFCLKT